MLVNHLSLSTFQSSAGSDAVENNKKIVIVRKMQNTSHPIQIRSVPQPVRPSLTLLARLRIKGNYVAVPSQQKIRIKHLLSSGQEARRGSQ